MGCTELVTTMVHQVPPRVSHWHPPMKEEEEEAQRSPTSLHC